MTRACAQQVLEQIIAFDAALLAADYESLRVWTSVDFTMILPTGAEIRKESWLTWLKTHVRYHRIERTEVRSRCFDPLVIVCAQVHSIMAVVGLFDGEARPHHTVRSEIWVCGPHGMRLEHVQLTRLPEAPP